MSELASARRFSSLAAVLTAIAWVAPIAQAAPTPGVVVLRNGNVLSGHVSRGPDHYIVEQSGAALRVPAEQVEVACGSLTEAYELRRQNRVAGSVDAHIELARWCLRHNLLNEAAREVLDVRTRDPGHLALPVVELQIRQALENETSRAKAAAKAELAAQQAVPTAPPPTSTLTPSTEVQAQFVRSIQPMLVNSCATGGCHHAPSSQVMQLDRWALEGNGNPELIRRNLEAVLAQIDAADPASSSLIVRGRQTHGNRRDGMSKPLATYQSALLLDWMNAAAGIEPEPQAEPATATTPSSTAPGVPVVVQQTAPAAGRAIRREYTPRDEFDPELFNRESAALATKPSEGALTDAEIEAALIEAEVEAAVKERTSAE